MHHASSAAAMSKEEEERFRSMIDSFLGGATNTGREQQSPPKVDEASLQKAMDKNKESLKVKLMMRRPINQLVEQGIMPSPKKPLQYLQQCQKLERAKTENILKNLMKQRPDRQALIDHHILEDTTIDPSLQDKQRQLKKARLADNLNDRLSHRPGPLELVKGNILHADEKFAQAVKEGQIPFKPTCEGQVLRHPAPIFTYEEDSGSDVALSPPQDLLDQSLGSMPSVESMVLSPYPSQDSPSSTSSNCEVRISPIFSVASPASSQSGNSSHSTHKENVSSSAIRRKKSKPKAQPKARTIKFHEYKGPPSAQKTPTQTEEESSYELLLQQQQLFLQWQLEMQQKYPQVILPVPQSSDEQSKLANSMQAVADALQMPCKTQSIEKPQVAEYSPPPNLIKNFQDLKVNGLKAECKKRNLPVSGNKVQLLERLRKNVQESNNNSNKPQPTNDQPTTINLNGIIIDSLVKQEPVTVSVEGTGPQQITLGDVVYNAVPVQGQIISRPGSTQPMDMECSVGDVMDCSEGNVNAINEEIVKRQQQKILQLERELERSQRQLQQQQWWQKQQQAQQQAAQQQVLLASHPVPIAPAPPTVTMTTTLQQPNATIIQQQPLLQPKPQQLSTPQQLFEQARKYPPGSAEQQSALVKASLAAFIHNQQVNNVRVRNGLSPINQQNISQFANLKPIVLCQSQAFPALVEKPRANSLPNGLAQQKMVWSSSVPNFTNVIAPKVTVGTVEPPKFLIQKAPPEYSEAVKPQNKPKQEKQSGSKSRSRKSVKSQEVDDVLDVLISHGELPPSAAQEPVTPSTPESQKGGMAPPAFPSVSEIQPTLNPSPSPTNYPSPKHPDPPTPTETNKPVDPHPNIVFDLNLDLQDLEAMDLGVLDRTEPPSDSPVSNGDSASQSQPTYGDIDMDVELTDWLEVLTNNNHPANQGQPSRTCGYNTDPLMPSMDSGQDNTLDMFGLDNLDFKLPSDSNLLSWDKIDYAT